MWRWQRRVKSTRPPARRRCGERRRAVALLQAEGLTRLFGGVRAVDGVDLSVRHGSVHGLIGPNGAGKTTLLNLIAGVFRSRRNAAIRRARHHPAFDRRRARCGIRRTFQNLKLFLEMTALENVAIGLHAETRCGLRRCGAADAAPAPGGARHRRAIDAGAAVRRPGGCCSRAGLTLAYGHRRLLEIARAIVAAPQLLLLDEPAAGLNATEVGACDRG